MKLDVQVGRDCNTLQMNFVNGLRDYHTHALTRLRSQLFRTSVVRKAFSDRATSPPTYYNNNTRGLLRTSLKLNFSQISTRKKSKQLGVFCLRDTDVGNVGIETSSVLRLRGSPLQTIQHDSNDIYIFLNSL